MTEREKVIKGLECCSDAVSKCGNNCPYWDIENCESSMQDDALALLKAQEQKCRECGEATSKAIQELQTKLKAQEPRVMTLEEVQQHNNQDGCVWFEQPTYNAVAAFVRKDEFEIEVISPYILGELINHGYWLSSNYNVTWRCWTSRPTDEQREAVKWE